MEQEKQSQAVKKLEVDRPSNFKYHAAYMAYSKTWDDNPAEEARTKLNEIMSSLSDEEESYGDFYNALSQFRKDFNPDLRSRGRVRTRSKREWKRSESNAARFSRYKR